LLLLDERITHFITSTFHVFVITRCVTRYKVIEMWWLSGIENFVRDDFIFNSFRNFKPVKRFQNRSVVLEFWSLDDSSSKSILDVLETIYLIFGSTEGCSSQAWSVRWR